MSWLAVAVGLVYRPSPIAHRPSPIAKSSWVDWPVLYGMAMAADAECSGVAVLS